MAETSQKTHKKKIIKTEKKVVNKSTIKSAKKTTNSPKNGRPKKEYLDYFTVQKTLEIFRMDWKVEEACSHANISRSTYYLRIEQKKTFLDKNPMGEEVEILYEDAVESAKEFAGILAKKTIQKAIMSWNAKIAMERQKRRDDRYRDKKEITWKDWEPLTISSEDQNHINVLLLINKKKK